MYPASDVPNKRSVTREVTKSLRFLTDGSPEKSMILKFAQIEDMLQNTYKIVNCVQA